MTDDHIGTETWTVRVEGGPAFMVNTIAALRWVLDDPDLHRTSPKHQCLERLAEACEQAVATK